VINHTPIWVGQQDRDPDNLLAASDKDEDSHDDDD
jgi:hypothetical protein